MVPQDRDIYQAPSARISILAKAKTPIEQAGYIEADRQRPIPILPLQTGGRPYILRWPCPAPVGAFLLGVPGWRGGFALAGLIPFFFAIPATPQAAMGYAEWVGRKEAAKLATLVLVAAVVSGVVAIAIVDAVGLNLPYVCSPDQLLRWCCAGANGRRVGE